MSIYNNNCIVSELQRFVTQPVILHNDIEILRVVRNCLAHNSLQIFADPVHKMLQDTTCIYIHVHIYRNKESGGYDGSTGCH